MNKLSYIQNRSFLFLATFLLPISSLTSNALSQVVFDAQELSNPNASFIDRYGSEVQSDGNLFFIGAHLDNFMGMDSGSVYVYNATTGSLVRQLNGSNTTGAEHFGFSIAASGNLMLIGSPNDTFGASRTGSAFFFNPNTGAELDYIGPSDDQAFQRFGNSLAVNSTISLVGAPLLDNPDGSVGAVYAFLNSTMKELTIFRPPLPRGNVRFGASLAMNESHFLIGSYGSSSPDDTFAGEVYVYSVITGLPTMLLTADIPGPASQFGQYVDLDGTKAVVGAKTDNTFGEDAGAVYVFDIISGDQLARIGSPDPHPQANFGSSVSISNGIIAVGADREDAAGESSGAVYTFDANTYELIAKSVPDELSAGSKFGASVTQIGQRVIAGADKLLTITTDSGNAYILDPYCRPDLNQDGNLNFLDVSAFLDTQLDWNGDGSFNFLDISGFLASYAEACAA
jgi:outer membrane protein assembly factor BamB